MLSDTIRSGTLDAPSWDYVRTAKLTTRLYAPLGTQMSLGEYVRVTQRFLEAFKANTALEGKLDQLRKDLKVRTCLLCVPLFLNNVRRNTRTNWSSTGSRTTVFADSFLDARFCTECVFDCRGPFSCSRSRCPDSYSGCPSLSRRSSPSTNSLHQDPCGTRTTSESPSGLPPQSHNATQIRTVQARVRSR